MSKKQLQGLASKASKVADMPQGWLATLEAIILKMPNRFKSTIEVTSAPVFQKDEKVGETIRLILDKYPAHKRVLFFQTKYENNEPLNATELSELERFRKILIK